MKSSIALLLLLVGCADNAPARATIAMTIGSGPPAYGDTPFPTDAVKDGIKLGVIAGLDRIARGQLDLVQAHVADLDGFGLRPLVELFVEGGEIDATTLVGAVALVDVDPRSAERGREIAMDWRFFADRHAIVGSPTSGEILREGTRYAAYATTAILDVNGVPVVAGAGLGELRAGRLPDERWRTTAEALDELPADLAGLAVFTTQHATAPLVRARAAMLALPPPILTFDDPAIIFTGTTQLDRILGQATRAVDGPRMGLERWGNDNPTGIAHDHVGTIATGTITIARFRGNDTHTNLPTDKTFTFDETGNPKLVAIDPIPITVILPAAVPPADGYPVIIYGHGLGASRDQLLSFAEPFTSRGFALVGIDMVTHGSRYDAGDHGANMAHQLPDFTGEPMLRDGFGDTTGAITQLAFFESFLNVAAVRDSIRQSALDLSRVVQAVRAHPDLAALGLPATAKLDTRRIAYTGESFGTVVGTLFAAIEPDIDLYILDVPGGGILDLILPSSPEISTLVIPLLGGLYRPPTTVDRWSPLIGLMQAVIDGGDPLSYANHVMRDRFTVGGRVLSPRSVVAIEVIGDQVLSNHGTEALVRELGLAVISPGLDVPSGLSTIGSPAAGNLDGMTGVLVQYSPATHGANWSAERGKLQYQPEINATVDDPYPRLPTPITIAEPIYETLDQVFEVLESHQRGEAPRVRLTLPPVHDFDGDGVVDANDPAPLDPATH